MNKFYAWVLAITMLLSLCGCQSSPDAELSTIPITTVQTDASTIETTTVPSVPASTGTQPPATTAPPATIPPTTQPPATTTPPASQTVTGVTNITGSKSNPFYKKAGIQINTTEPVNDQGLDDAGNPLIWSQWEFDIRNTEIGYGTNEDFKSRKLDKAHVFVDFNYSEYPAVTNIDEADIYDCWAVLYNAYTEATSDPVSFENWIAKYSGYACTFVMTDVELIPQDEGKECTALSSRARVGLMDKYTGACFPACWTKDRLRKCTVTVDGVAYDIMVYIICDVGYIAVGDEYRYSGAYYAYLLAPKAYDGAVLYVGSGDKSVNEQTESIGDAVIKYEDIPEHSEELYFFEIPEGHVYVEDEPVEPVIPTTPPATEPTRPEPPQFTGSKETPVHNGSSPFVPSSSSEGEVTYYRWWKDEDDWSESYFETTIAYGEKELFENANRDICSPWITIKRSSGLDFDFYSSFTGDYDLSRAAAWIEEYKDYDIVCVQGQIKSTCLSKPHPLYQICLQTGFMDRYTGLCLPLYQLQDGESTSMECNLVIDGEAHHIMAFGSIDSSCYMEGQMTILYMAIAMPKSYDGAMFYFGEADQEIVETMLALRGKLWLYDELPKNTLDFFVIPE